MSDFTMESVRVTEVGDVQRGLKAIALRVEGGVPERVGAVVRLNVPESFPVAVGDQGSALWLPGEKLPKLVLGPSVGP